MSECLCNVCFLYTGGKCVFTHLAMKGREGERESHKMSGFLYTGERDVGIFLANS